MTRRLFRFASLCAAAACVFALVASASAEAAEVTIGANVNQTTSESGTCGYKEASERPCVIVTNFIPAGPSLTSPCSGTVTHFRLNGFPRPLNHYSLRVIRRNADGSYTGTATSAPVQIATEGVNEYATSLPIATGEEIGIDFLDSLEEHGLRWVGGLGVNAAVLFEFPADGTAASPTIPPASFYYLFNADIACASPSPPPPPPSTTAPSNAFQVVSLKKTTLTLRLASAGSVTVTEAVAKKKTKGHKRAKHLLKPSSANGGPGLVKLKLALTPVAKQKLRETGKLKLRASLAFTPTGGRTALQVRSLKMRGQASRTPR